ncbi:MAG TPA: LysM peptidoglycan-binding domain-containing protein [bacterium]|nr:LysM peptidoglycan-binding domain-containing protein [bacterium]
MLATQRWAHGLRQAMCPSRWTLAALCWLAVVALAQAAAVTYTVKSGDNPWIIAKKFGIPVEELLQANNLSEKSVLAIGQKLTIPGQEAPAAAKVAAEGEVIEYAVVKGDTLSEIAEAHEVSLAELLAANSITTQHMLQVGMKLKIPVDEPAADGAVPDPNVEAVSHVLKPGESLWTVAKKYGIKVNDLATYNRVGTGQVLQPGFVLEVPPAGVAAPKDVADGIDPNAPIGGSVLSLSAGAPLAAGSLGDDTDITHVVQAGDTVSHLAVKYRTTRQAIFEANRLANRDTLAPGRQLVIPRGSLDRDRAKIANVEANRNTRALPSRDTSIQQRVVKYALQFQGTPYKWAGTDLRRGVDCSGFVLAVYKNFGKNLPHSSKAMAGVGQRVRREELQPGDIILFHTTRSGISHAGLYLGGGKFIHASTNQRKVRIDSLSDAYYNRAYVTARRVL